jgi:2Fe-2S ferredoxin
VIEAEEGKSICENLLANGSNSTTPAKCPAPARPATSSSARVSTRWKPAEDIEEDLLDKAWGLEPNSRLGCQAIVRSTPLTVEIPKYSINMAKEGHRK